MGVDTARALRHEHPARCERKRPGATLSQEHPPLSSAASLAVFRFPTLPDERMVMLVAAIVGAGVLVFALLQIAAVAADGGASVKELFAGSQALRALVAAMVLLYVTGVLSALAYASVRANSELAMLPDGIRYKRAPLPVVRVGGYSVRVGWAGIDLVRVHRCRRGLTMSSELEIVAGRDTIRLNLDRAIDIQGRRPSAAKPPLPLEQHPAVVALVRQRGRPLDP